MKRINLLNNIGDADLNDSGHLGTSSRETEEESSGSSIHSECESRGVYILYFACNVYSIILILLC